MILDLLWQFFVLLKVSLSLFSDSQPIFLPSYVFSLLFYQPKPMKFILKVLYRLVIVMIHKPVFVVAAQPPDFLAGLAFPFDELL